MVKFLGYYIYLLIYMNNSTLLILALLFQHSLHLGLSSKMRHLILKPTRVKRSFKCWVLRLGASSLLGTHKLCLLNLCCKGHQSLITRDFSKKLCIKALPYLKSCNLDDPRRQYRRLVLSHNQVLFLMQDNAAFLSS